MQQIIYKISNHIGGFMKQLNKISNHTGVVMKQLHKISTHIGCFMKKRNDYLSYQFQPRGCCCWGKWLSNTISGRLARRPYIKCNKRTYFTAPCKAPQYAGRLARRPKCCLIISTNHGDVILSHLWVLLKLNARHKSYYAARTIIWYRVPENKWKWAPCTYLISLQGAQHIAAPCKAPQNTCFYGILCKGALQGALK